MVHGHKQQIPLRRRLFSFLEIVSDLGQEGFSAFYSAVTVYFMEPSSEFHAFLYDCIMQIQGAKFRLPPPPPAECGRPRSI